MHGGDVDRFCAVIPAYKEEARVGEVAAAARAFVDEVLVVDDGSPDGTAAAAERAGAAVVRHGANRGKGRALETGLAWAVERGFTAAVTLDADGQHDPREIPRFTDEFSRTRADIILGTRMRDRGDMPLVRSATNFFTSAVISCIAGQRITDSQSGFRLLRCDTAARLPVAGARFDAESEVIILAARKGYLIREVPISTIYGDEGSKINPLRDTCRFVSMALRFIFLQR